MVILLALLGWRVSWGVSARQGLGEALLRPGDTQRFPIPGSRWQDALGSERRSFPSSKLRAKVTNLHPVMWVPEALSRASRGPRFPRSPQSNKEGPVSASVFVQQQTEPLVRWAARGHCSRSLREVGGKRRKKTLRGNCHRFQTPYHLTVSLRGATAAYHDKQWL